MCVKDWPSGQLRLRRGLCADTDVRSIALQKPYGSIGADLWYGEPPENRAMTMLSSSDVRLFVLIPFGLAVVAMLWILWHLLRDGRQR